MAARISTQSGLWSDTATWGGLSVPVSGDTVTISAGHIVTFDVDESGFAVGLAALVITGTLQVSTTVGTYVLKMAANITGTGSLLAGSSGTPLPSTITMTFTFNGAFGINMTGGIVAMYGAVKTLYRTTLTNAESAADTVLEVDNDPTSWANGELIRISDIAGTLADSEQRTILSTTSNSITITAGLTNAKASGSIVTGISRNIKIVGSAAGIGLNVINNGGLTLSNVEVRGFTTNISGCTSANLANCSISGATTGISVTTNMSDNGSDIVGNTTNINGGGGTYTNTWVVGSAGTVSLGTLLLKNSHWHGLNNALGSAISVTAYNCIFSGNTTTLNASRGTFIDCTFNSITTNASSIFGCKFYNCSFTGAEFNNYNTVSLLPHDYSVSFDHNQVVGDFRSWTRGAITSRNAAILDSPAGGDSYNTALESASLLGFWQQSIVVLPGQTLNLTAYLRKDVSMSFLPRVQVFEPQDDPLITGLTPIIEQQMSNSIDTWESFALSLTNTTDDLAEYIIRFEGMNATGNMYSDLAIVFSSANNRNGRAGCRRCN